MYVAIMVYLSIFIFPFSTLLPRNFRLILVFMSYFSFFLVYFSSFHFYRRNYLGLFNFNKLILFVFLYILIILLCIFLYFTQWYQYLSLFEKIYNYSMFFMPVLIIQILFQLNDRKLISFSLFLIVFIYFLTSVTTILGLVQFPTASRDLASGISLNLYSSRNIGGFGFIYSLPLLAVYLIRQKRFLFLRFLFWLILFYTVLLSQYSIAIFMYFLTTLLWFNKLKFIFFFTGLLLIIILSGISYFLLNNQIIILFEAIYDFFHTNNIYFVSEKINDFLLFLRTNSFGLSWEMRFDKYSLSLNTFLNSVYFGSLFYGTISVGGHSEILDFFGSLGLFGLFIFIIIIIIIRKLNFLKSNESFKFASFFLILTGLFNPISSFPQIMITYLIPSSFKNYEE